MTEPARLDPVVLDDLAGATREYATYGSTAFGLAYSAWGGLLLIAALACVASPTWGPLLVFPSAPAWFLMIRRARRYYQRRGGVTGVEQGMSPRRARQNGLVLLLLVCGFVLFKIARHQAAWSASQGLPASVAMAVAAACTVLAFVLAIAWGRGYRDTYTPFIVMWLWGLLVASDTAFLPASRSEAAAPAALLAITGLFFAVRGGHEHEAWKALDRRMAGLQVGAP